MPKLILIFKIQNVQKHNDSWGIGLSKNLVIFIELDYKLPIKMKVVLFIKY